MKGAPGGSITQAEIDEILSGIHKHKSTAADTDERLEHKQKKAFQRLFRVPSNTGPYPSNLDYLEELLQCQAQKFTLLQASHAASSNTDAFESLAHDFLFFNPVAYAEAKRINQALATKIRERLKLTKFIPGYVQLVRREKLKKRDAEMILIVFMLKLSNHEINMRQLTDLYAQGFKQRIEFKKCLNAKSSPIGKKLLYTRLNLFDEATVLIHGDVFNLILGASVLEEEYMAYGILGNKPIAWEAVVLPKEDKERIYSLVYHHTTTRNRLKQWGYDRVAAYGLATTILFQGKSGTGKTMFAHALATRLKKKVMTADVNQIMDRLDSAAALRSLLIQAKMQDAILFLDECERLLGSAHMRDSKVTDVLKAMEEFDGIVIFATNVLDDMDLAMRRRILHTLTFEVPGAAAREQIWRAHITPKTQMVGTIDFRYLAEKYDLTGGLIKNSVLLAAAMAVDRNPLRPAITQADLEKASELQRRAGHELLVGEDVAYHQRYDLRFLAYDPNVRKQIDVLIAACRQREEIWRKWGFSEKFAHGSGVCALFNGPSGTGKTAAAYAIAAELGLPVRTIEFASLLSMWHGDTENKVLRMFQQLKGKTEVVVFDECESLLTARDGQASRIQANIVNIFLRHLETFDGILLMTTNLKEELDSALERRLLFRIDFSLPSSKIREEIWRVTLPSSAPFSPSINWRKLSAEYEFTGAQIKNCVISAMYSALSDRASEITESHLRRACAQQTIGLEKRKPIGFFAAS